SPRARRAGTPASWSPTRVSGSPASPSSLLRFLMQLVFVAPRAVLPPLHPLGVLAPVLGRHVVAALAPRALQDDVLARHRGGPALQDLGDDAGADGAAAFADGEAQLFFHGDGGDELDR